MSKTTKKVHYDTLIAFSDHHSIARQLDSIAAHEGLKRTDILRRFVRSQLQQLQADGHPAVRTAQPETAIT